jgi:hypothetical protein
LLWSILHNGYGVRTPTGVSLRRGGTHGFLEKEQDMTKRSVLSRIYSTSLKDLFSRAISDKNDEASTYLAMLLIKEDIMASGLRRKEEEALEKWGARLNKVKMPRAMQLLDELQRFNNHLPQTLSYLYEEIFCGWLFVEKKDEARIVQFILKNAATRSSRNPEQFEQALKHCLGQVGGSDYLNKLARLVRAAQHFQGDEAVHKLVQTVAHAFVRRASTGDIAQALEGYLLG